MYAVSNIIHFPSGRLMTEWQGFYSTAQVSRLAGVPSSTLYDWRRRRIVVPSVQIIGESGKEDEGYSYADLAIAKLLRGLREKNLNLRSVAVAFRHIYDRFGPPTSPGWQGAHVFVVKNSAFARKPDEWDTTVATRYGQKMMDLLAPSLFEEEAAFLVPKTFSEYVEINLRVMEGQPVIKDTRVPTSVIAMMFAQGTTIALLATLYSPIPQLHLEKAIDFERSLDKAAAGISS